MEKNRQKSAWTLGKKEGQKEGRKEKKKEK